MMVPGLSENVDCPRDEIASYIDGEMSLSEETVFEDHLSRCEACRSETKDQKEFLLALSSSLDSEQDIPLPKDFTRTIVANAESRVSGLRLPRERFTAIFICAALFLFSLFALGCDAETAWRALGSVAEKVLAVGSYLMRLVFSIFFGMAVITRSLFSHISVSWLLAPVLILLISTALFALSRTLLRSSHTQEN